MKALGPRDAVTLDIATFLADRQGRTFADIANDTDIGFDDVLAFFSSPDRQRRMEESEIDHDRPALAGVVREFESLPRVNSFMSEQSQSRAKRLRQAVGVVVRMIMEARGWSKSGRKGSLGVRTTTNHDRSEPGAHHNTGGLSLWFLRAERYVPIDGMPYTTVRDRSGAMSEAQVEPAAS